MTKPLSKTKLDQTVIFKLDATTLKLAKKVAANKYQYNFSAYLRDLIKKSLETA